MTNVLRHRGPDDEGIWEDRDRGIALGHRRLAVVDLSAEGHQPMHSRCGRYVIAYNGEIYNFEQIRLQLEGLSNPVRWRGHSDTEVLLEAMAFWGLEATLKQLNGMFAFAVWDRQKQTLHLARDRVGKKPLYYTWSAAGFMFGSELKALRACRWWEPEVDSRVLEHYLQHGYISSPHSIYRGVFQLMPGHVLSITASEPTFITDTLGQPYWSPTLVREHNYHDGSKTTADCAVNDLEKLLRDSIKLRLVADVPVGAFLSGGVDSSLVVALAQKEAAKSIKTFSIGFNERGYNEADHARAVAKYLGTNHQELLLSSKDALSVVEQIPHIYDEPFADPSAIPTFIVSSFAREQVTVALSGDGGDELFGGYSHYRRGLRIWNTREAIPDMARTGLFRNVAELVRLASVAARPMTAVKLPGRSTIASMVAQMDKLHACLLAESLPELRAAFSSHHPHISQLLNNSVSSPVDDLELDRSVSQGSPLHILSSLDLMNYLPDDILVKVDRASMRVSLEVRAPVLDYRLVEFAMGLPLEWKIRRGQSKWLFKQLLYRHVPRALVDRPKQGFRVPVGSWLRGDLRPWAEELLRDSSGVLSNFLNLEEVQKIWKEHLAERRNWQGVLWNILMLAEWLRMQRDGSADSTQTELKCSG